MLGGVPMENHHKTGIRVVCLVIAVLMVAGLFSSVVYSLV